MGSRRGPLSGLTSFFFFFFLLLSCMPGLATLLDVRVLSATVMLEYRLENGLNLEGGQTGSLAMVDAIKNRYVR